MAAPIVRIGRRIPERIRAAAEAALARAGSEAVRIIKDRTAAGVDSRGAAFRPYSRGYRNAKMASGRDSGRVDLRLSGEMLRSLTVRRTIGGPRPVCVIGFDLQHRRRAWRTSRKAAFSNRDSKRTIRKRTPAKTTGTVPMFKIISGLQRHRRFFEIVSAREKARLVIVIRKAMAAEWRRTATR